MPSSFARPLTSALDGGAVSVALSHQVGHIHLERVRKVTKVRILRAQFSPMVTLNAYGGLYGLSGILRYGQDGGAGLSSM